MPGADLETGRGVEMEERVNSGDKRATEEEEETPAEEGIASGEFIGDQGYKGKIGCEVSSK